MMRYVIVCVLCVLSFGTLAQTPSVAPPQKSFGPITDYMTALPNSGDSLRSRRGERYNSPNSPLPELGEQSDLVVVVEDMSSFYHNPTPFDQSDAVVVGRIESGQAYLSNDKRDIYTEFTVALDEVLRGPTEHISAGDTIQVERHGGAVLLPSGKVLIRGSRDYSLPLIGKRYLLFLQYHQNTEDFHIVMGYQLEGQRTYILDELGYSLSDRQHETIIHPLREQGESEEQLLQRAKAANLLKANPPKGGK